MTATERLRELLNERGVKWHNRDSEGDHGDCRVFKTWWKGNLFYEESYPNGDSYTLLEARAVEGITPEQAVEATLGRGTCHDIGTFKSWGLFTCSNCSIVVQLNAAKDAPEIGKNVPLKFCPSCGRRLEVDE